MFIVPDFPGAASEIGRVDMVAVALLIGNCYIESWAKDA